MGPAHPAMHGIVRIFAELDGETVVKTDVEIGYLHRAFEKDCEAGPYNNAIPYTDRLNYVSPLINNFGYARRWRSCSASRSPSGASTSAVIMSEISRICDHLTCVGAGSMELGAFTVFLYMIKAREFLWELVEDVTGARLTISYGRVGGVKADLPAGFDLKVSKAFAETRQVLEEVHTLVTGNRIFMDRMVGVGALSKEDTIAWGITGPLLRAAGVPFDLRKTQPYWAYDRIPFEIPLGKNGDNFDRYPRAHGRDGAVDAHRGAGARRLARRADPGGLGGQGHPARRLRRPRQAGKDRGPAAAADHALAESPGPGPAARTTASTPPTSAWCCPPKATTYGSIEGLMNHFMLVMDGYGIRPPAGEAYFAVGGRQRRAGLLRGVRRQRPALPRALPAAVPASGRRAAQDDRGRDGRRHHPHLRLRQHDRRRAGPLAHARRAAA